MLKKNSPKPWPCFFPGIFLLGFNIGTGQRNIHGQGRSHVRHVAAVDDRGFLPGNLLYDLNLWQIYPRTGETALQAFRKHIHPAVGIFFIVALTAGVSGSVMGVMGIVADISQSGRKR